MQFIESQFIKMRLCLLVVFIVTSGCVNLSTRYERGNIYWGGYSAGQRYIMMSDCFLARVNDGLEGDRYALLPEGRVKSPGRIHSAPQSISSWKEGIRNDWSSTDVKIVGVVPFGTYIEPKFTKVNRGWSMWTGSYCVPVVYAEVIDGAYTGTLVDLTDLSNLRRGETGRNPNPALLREVSGTESRVRISEP